MAKKYWDEEINKHQDWGGDASTENLPVLGSRVQQFIKTQLEGKGGNRLYVPSNATGYDSGAWATLLDPTKCGFTLSKTL